MIGGAVLYCPKCDKEQTMSFERASIELNKVKARKEYEGGDYFDPLY